MALGAGGVHDGALVRAQRFIHDMGAGAVADCDTAGQGGGAAVHRLWEWVLSAGGGEEEAAAVLVRLCVRVRRLCQGVLVCARASLSLLFSPSLHPFLSHHVSVCVRLVKAEEALSIDYGNGFYRPVEERRRLLQSSYLFECMCDACVKVVCVCVCLCASLTLSHS